METVHLDGRWITFICLGFVFSSFYLFVLYQGLEQMSSVHKATKFPGILLTRLKQSTCVLKREEL